ncbi:hypothetical protein IFR05_004663 [Cadophora sp. M221]|nr:hypothetical protein IFR05_004663 [Cadophora sp. M221]
MKASWIINRPWRTFRKGVEKIAGEEYFWAVFWILSLCLFTTLCLYIDNTRQWRETDYPALPYPASSIRILHIQPSSRNGAIYGELRSYPLAQRPEFEALSYQWGDPKNPKSVYVNGKKMKISKNAHDALRSIRHSNKVRRIWIDQICINQVDTEEKNSQIPLMTFIYGRAIATLVWLGNHKGPRWVEGAEGLDWSGEWAVAHASKYSLAAKRWLYLLSEEEYWKRTWIIQEIGMSSNIQVHFGRKSLPWGVFIELMEWYRREYPRANVNSILGLNALRQTMYLDKSSFSLAYLLTEFFDSVSTIPLDKIFGFVGMANECRNGCIDVDYSKSLYDVYQDVIWTLDMSSDIEFENRIEMMHVASIVRQNLERKSSLVPKTMDDFGQRADPNSWIYSSCGDEKATTCHSDSSGNITREAEFLDRVTGAMRWLGSFVVRSPHRYTSVWLPMASESADIWLPSESLPDHSTKSNMIQVRGLIAGSVAHIGPSYSSFIGDFKIVKWWTREVDFYPNILDQRKARGLNDRFMNLLGTSPYSLLSYVVPISATSSSASDGPNLFLGSSVMVGLLPSNAKVGDKLVQFSNTNSVAVVRNGTDGEYEIIGRALIVKDLNEFDWDTPRNRALFQADLSHTIDLLMSVSTLTKLSLDSVQLGNH